MRRHGEPEPPSKLEEHVYLAYRYPPNERTWEFHEPERTDVPIDGTVDGHTGTLVVDGATSGVGVEMAPEFLVADALRAGELEPILTDWSAAPEAVWALYPHRRHLSAKVQTFTEFLDERFSPPPWRDQEGDVIP